MTATQLRPQDFRQMKASLPAFARAVRWPLESWQAEALSLGTKVTALLSARQLGKSSCLALLGAWRSYVSAGHRTLILSAGEEASRRLLSVVKDICSHELLADSVTDEQASLIRLKNGSEIRSLPASEKQVRGWSVDTLLIDEASLIPDDLIEGAAYPTTMARSDSRIVMASSPWAPEGSFYRAVQAGDDPANTTTATFRWQVSQAPWISPESLEHLRTSLSPLRYQSEVLGEFVGSGTAFLSRQEILDATAPYALLDPADANGQKVCVGLDWGRMNDSHAIVCVGSLLDFGRNGPVSPLYVPWFETSRRPYAAQVATVARLHWRRPGHSYDIHATEDGGPDRRFWPSARDFAREHARRTARGYDVVQVLSELNGVGAMPSERVASVMRGVPVVGVHSSSQSKETAYGKLRVLLSERQLLLPAEQEFTRQLAGLGAEALPSGGLRIAATNPSVHDDLPDALTLALSGVPDKLRPGRPAEAPDGTEWLVTGNGIEVPAKPTPRRNAFADMGGKFRTY